MKLPGLVLALFFCFISSAAFAQATANFTASVTIIQPIGITTTSNMEFANLDANSGGEVILTPESTRMTSGGVILEEGGNVSAASFEITGQPGLSFDLSLPEEQHILSNGNDNIIIRDFTSTFQGARVLAPTAQTINVGATIDVNPNQTPGRYTSQSPLNVTVNYN